MEDHYSVLGVARDAPREEIKRSYRKKLMGCHPDKHCGSAEEFLKLDLAWKAIGDEERRKAYDAKMKQQEALVNHPVNEEVKLQDMDIDKNGHFIWDCRCGGHYILTDAPRCNTYVGCDSCSYIILVYR